MKQTCAIIIMDGYGLAPAGEGNAISIDGSKNVNAYRAEYPPLRWARAAEPWGFPTVRWEIPKSVT